jgi:hypothetical protein
MKSEADVCCYKAALLLRSSNMREGPGTDVARVIQ